MSIFREVAGYTYGHADIVRRAMSKKKADVMEAERKSFIEGAAEKGMAEADATKLFDEMSSFANYAFNKSHAAAYAVISYRTAYLKAHYPKHYFAALLTSVLDSPGKIAEYISDCEKRSIKVKAPDINESHIYFHVSGDNIRFGLAALKNIGVQFSANIIKEREKGRFSSFEDFVTRMSAVDLNKRQLETLIKSGAFDSLGIFRSRLMASYERMLEGISNRARHNLSGQLDMFAAMPSSGGGYAEPLFEYPNIPEFTAKEKLLQEKEAGGMYFSGHLLDDYTKHIAEIDHLPLSSFSGEDGEEGALKDKQYVKVVGIITSITTKITKKDERMAFFTLEDRFSSVECIAFPNRYARESQKIRHEAAVIIEGNVMVREDEKNRIAISNISFLETNSEYTPKPQSSPEQKSSSNNVSNDTNTAANHIKRLFLRVPDRESTEFLKAVNLVDIFEGNTAVVFYRSDEKSYFTYNRGIALSDVVVSELKALLGNENVIIK